MFVSKRILFFKSKENGYMLFCGNSNSFYHNDDENVPVIQKMIDTGSEEGLPEDIRKEFVKSGVLLNESDEDFFNRMKFNSTFVRFQSEKISLTIAPTMACNFKCTYCYEGNRVNGEKMDFQILDSIISFLKKNDYKKIEIIWYGGEPLLAFDRILYFNKLLEKNNIKNCKQSIITNGSLLDINKLQFFIQKKFEFIQITLDGDEKLHNKRRPMKNGQNSYKTIISNLDTCYKYLRDNSLSIKIILRINLDKNNSNYYEQLVEFIYSRYDGYILCQPAFIIKSSESVCNHRNCMSSLEESEFILRLVKGKKEYSKDFYPLCNKFVHCSAQCLNYYLIDVKGNMYKCLEDIGILENSVGNIKDGFLDIKNLNYKYILDSTGFEEAECKNCLFLYSCAGGCAKRRWKNIEKRKVLNPVCLSIKNNTTDFLEAYYEMKKSSCVARNK